MIRVQAPTRLHNTPLSPVGGRPLTAELQHVTTKAEAATVGGARDAWGPMRVLVGVDAAKGVPPIDAARREDRGGAWRPPGLVPGPIALRPVSRLDAGCRVAPGSEGRMLPDGGLLAVGKEGVVGEPHAAGIGARHGRVNWHAIRAGHAVVYKPRCWDLSGPETLAIPRPRGPAGRQTICLKGFGARGACVLERQCSESAVFWDR